MTRKNTIPMKMGVVAFEIRCARAIHAQLQRSN
jgi:hypothetical protein